MRTDDELKECMGKCLIENAVFPENIVFPKIIVFVVGMTFSSFFEAPGRIASGKRFACGESVDPPL